MTCCASLGLHSIMMYVLILSFIRHPSIFTIFPYTTLFRSEKARNDLPLDERLANYILEGTRDGLVADLERKRTEGAAPLDRKSTRLNSSHRCISYAVF